VDAADLPLPSLDNLALQTPLLLRKKWADDGVADAVVAEPDRMEDGDIFTAANDSANLDVRDQHGNKRDRSIEGSMTSDLVGHKSKKQK
jgi:hypothetical protein